MLRTAILTIACALAVGTFAQTTTFAGPTEEKKVSTATGELAKPPLDYAADAEKGSLKNPYTGDAKAIEEGKGLFFSYSCNGCHGGGGGGGMCPPLTNQVWIYGGDDDTLFRLISMGSDKLAQAGYSRKRSEKVKGPMPPFGELVENADELWKILAWVRTKYKGSPESKEW